jgi:hypothetical protein
MIEFGLLVLEKKILKTFQCIFTILQLSPLREGLSPLFEQKFQSPSPKDDLCQIWLKLAQWFWRRFLNDPTPFLHLCDYLPFEVDLALYLNKLEFPLPSLLVLEKIFL